MSKIALVTGANRGMGFETVRQLAKLGITTILSARDAKKGEQATALLQEEGLPVIFHQLDVTDEESIQRIRIFIENEFGKLDILINNAGTFVETSDPTQIKAASFFSTSLETIKQTLDINAFGAYKLCRLLVPLMIKNNYGRVVNVTSGMGTLHEMGAGWPGYRLSKTALNVLTRIVASETIDKNIKVNSVCPGWVMTEMGGPSANKTIEEGVETTVWLATLDDNGPTGKFFRDKQEIEW